MFSFFRQWARNGTRKGAQAPAVRRLECESLEDRTLPSLTGAQLFARSLPLADHAVVASVPGGRSVVAWEVAVSSRDHDIKAQVFDSTGHKIGGVITVASGRVNQYTPTVAVNAAGQFVVAWVIDFTSTDRDIHATLFRSNLTRVRNDFPVAWSYKSEYTPKAGIDARGNFDVSYTLKFGSSDTDVKAGMFNSSGTFLRTVSVATSTKVEANTGMTVASTGKFAVSYVSAGINMIRHFSSSGSPLDAGVRAPSTPTPTPTPTPAPAPALRGRIAGGYYVVPLGTGKGSRYDLVGIGNLARLGEETVSGSLFSTSSTTTHATGVLTLHDVNGTIRLSLVGPTQAHNAALPTQFRYTVTSGTGTHSSFRSSGVIYVHLVPTTHTLTLDIYPTV
jgi:hypothetical protein